MGKSQTMDCASDINIYLCVNFFYKTFNNDSDFVARITKCIGQWVILNS
jgi:hypothetical protein